MQHHLLLVHLEEGRNSIKACVGYLMDRILRQHHQALRIILLALVLPHHRNHPTPDAFLTPGRRFGLLITRAGWHPGHENQRKRIALSSEPKNRTGSVYTCECNSLGSYEKKELLCQERINDNQKQRLTRS
jgi:hypothetical protein